VPVGCALGLYEGRAPEMRIEGRLDGIRVEAYGFRILRHLVVAKLETASQSVVQVVVRRVA